MARYKIGYVSTIVILLCLCIVSGHGVLLIPLMLLLCGEVMSAIFLMLASRNTRIKFKANGKCVVNKPLPVKITVETESRMPIGRISVMLKYNNTMFGTQTGQSLILQPARGKAIEYELLYIPPDCGRVQITVQYAVCYDLFGIISKKIPQLPDMEIVVYPQIQNFNIRKARRPKSSQSSEQYDAERKGSDVTEVFDIRDYEEGDSMRSIHWKLSGKLDHIVVREFANPTRYQSMLFYDTAFYANDDNSPEAVQKKHALANAVLTMTAALSKNMMEENMPHCVVTQPYGTIDKSQVENRNSYDVMLTKLMHGRLIDAGDGQMRSFTEADLFSEFSKIIVVTDDSDNSVLRANAENNNITAIMLSQTGENRVEKQGKMEIIRIPIDKLEGAVHAIEI